jgi:dephospho-CoA kinase
MRIRVVGLTGGIASGKSTVSAMLREMGVPIVDADVIARQVVEPGSSTLAQVAAAFPGVLRPDGSLDRPRLGELVFADPAARARLNAIVHPAIMTSSREQLDALQAAGHLLAVYDAALILENGLGGAMDALIVVSVPEAVQLERLRVRDGIPEELARHRIAAQMPLAEKAARADYVIDNSGTLEQTRACVGEVWAHIRERFAREDA